MRVHRRIALFGAVLLVAAACGDDSGGDITVTVIPLPDSTTTAPGSTVASPDATLGADQADAAALSLDGQMFEDPFMETGYHAMSLSDEVGALASEESLRGTVPGVDVLALAPVSPVPTTSGLAPNQTLLEAWIDGYSGDFVPTATVLYQQGAEGWAARFVIDAESVEAALLETTDYAAAAPAGPVGVDLKVSAFDWTGGMFRASVAVVDLFAGFESVYEGEIECMISDPLVCTTLTDDGVLRPGDEGEDVEALQNDLAALGYLTGTIDGKYGPQTSDAVAAFQTDFLLTVDGKAGPNTLSMLADVVSGVSDLFVVSQGGIGVVVFGTPADPAYGDLFDRLGNPDVSTGWYSDACDGHDWLKASWDGFTAIFTDRDGFRQLDGWAIDDLADLPDGLLIAGGIRSDWSWSDFVSAGAEFSPDYGGFFTMVDLGYNSGRFVDPPTNPPAGGSAISGFGAGTGAFVTC